MKKNYKTNRVMRLLITLMLMATLLLGCSSTEAETETAEAKPEVEAPAEETKPEETETTEVETEATEEEPAEEVAEDSGEVTYITNYTSISDYMGGLLDSDKPAIVIYNEEEGYIINMQDGQYYQLKSGDQMLFNYVGDGIGWGWNIELGDTTQRFDTYSLFLIDYSKMQPKQEFFLLKTLDSGEEVRITCYFDPPTE